MIKHKHEFGMNERCVCGVFEIDYLRDAVEKDHCPGCDGFNCPGLLVDEDKDAK